MISCYKIVRKRKIYISESLPSTSSTSQDKTVDPQQENWTLLTLMKVKRSFSRNIVGVIVILKNLNYTAWGSFILLGITP